MDYYQNWHRRKNLKSKIEFVGGKHRTTRSTPYPILPQNPILGEKSSKYMQILITTQNCVECTRIVEIPRSTRNLGRGTRYWRQILDHKWKYGRFAHAQWKICNIYITLIIYYRRNSSVVVDLLWGRYHVPQNGFLVLHKICKKVNIGP